MCKTATCCVCNPRSPPAPSRGLDMSTAMKSCPLCGQEILAVAVKCRHCRRYLDPHRRREEGRSAGILGNTPDRAIAAGYLGLLSLFPFVGIAFGIGAVFFGSKALRLIRDEPGRDGRGRRHPRASSENHHQQRRGHLGWHHKRGGHLLQSGRQACFDDRASAKHRLVRWVHGCPGGKRTA